MCALTRRDAADVCSSVTAADYRVIESCRTRLRKLVMAGKTGKLLPRNCNGRFMRDILHSRRLCSSPIDPGLITGTVEVRVPSARASRGIESTLFVSNF